ncbi:crotonase/enoyl-CoA hydratase family protein [Pueribacillus theae]|uniref:crotonase/enoyl-CoA hydratase family protein n=1 Tax=Pueribacillus theae TaxID=2171751 RepID=UPI00197F5566|nr:crotonase/enoyl-CoA hydratase family protein [Pueribacillus theae]
MYETLKVDVSERIMTVTLNRPERLNAFNSQMMNELISVFDRADADDGVRAIIMTGEGRGFCAGADLEKGGEAFARDTSIDEHRDGGGMVSLRIYELKKPIIAAINGPAVGVGITMTLPMDIRIAANNAKIGFVFARRGIVPEACSGWFLPRIVGISQALKWVYSGKVFSAEEALHGGLISEVVAPEDLMKTARATAIEIAENTSATSVALSRQLMWTMLGADHPMESHKIESKLIRWAGRMPDSKEGVESFLEKRRPDFKMRVSKDLPEFFPWGEERKFHE